LTSFLSVVKIWEILDRFQASCILFKSWIFAELAENTSTTEWYTHVLGISQQEHLQISWNLEGMNYTARSRYWTWLKATQFEWFSKILALGWILKLSKIGWTFVGLNLVELGLCWVQTAPRSHEGLTGPQPGFRIHPSAFRYDPRTQKLLLLAIGKRKITYIWVVYPNISMVKDDQ